MNAKIRDFGLQKIPFILILGDKEAATDSRQRPRPRQRRRRRCCVGRLHHSRGYVGE